MHEHCAGARAAEDGGSPQPASLPQYRRSRALTSLPVLRRAHVHHREVSARNHTSHSPVDTDPCDRVRQLMITVDTPCCKVARPCCWLPSGHANVRPAHRHSGGSSTDLHCCMPAAMVHPPPPSLQLDRPLPSRSSTSIDDGVCGPRILIAPAARSPSPSRDFVPWPFADAGRRCMPRRRHGAHQLVSRVAESEPRPDAQKGATELITLEYIGN